MNKKITIIGGDLRLVNLAVLYAEEDCEVYTFALENIKNKLDGYKNIYFCKSLNEAVELSNTIISSIPLSKDGVYVNTPYSDIKLGLEELFASLESKKFIAGKIDSNLKKDVKAEICDILEIEEYSVLNSLATAEGAIQIAMEEYPRTICGSNVLVLGFGRIGKIVSKMLNGIGANVYCEARKSSDLAYIEAYSYIPVDLKNLNSILNKVDIIINNIPTMILDETKLNLLKKDTLILDLASKPGGVDFDYAEKIGIKTIWALGLPGKVAPLSAAEYIKRIVEKI